MRKLILIILLAISYTENNNHLVSSHNEFPDKCGFGQHEIRTHRPDRDTYIDSPTGHFRVHYNTSGQHLATTSYAEQVGEAADYSRNILVDVMGYLPEIDDADGIYDIYLYGFQNGMYGYNASDCEGYYVSSGECYCTGDEVAGASFIVIDNDFNYSCSDISGMSNLCEF